ncbi:MAG: efflux RND transporter periplasmic adaptor subunit [Acidobacteria bacterium]|nr:MAG: efflux RND transporter periplasmic adaptor subunit [Acidobacteriota bacterium]
MNRHWALIACLWAAVLAAISCDAGAGAAPAGRGEGHRPRAAGQRPAEPRHREAAGGRPERRRTAEEARVPVIVAPVVRGRMQAYLDASSTLRAEEQVAVVSQATGVVVEILAEQGDTVRKGQLLARLAYEDLELAERRARNEFERLRAEHERAAALAQDHLLSEEEYQKTGFDLERARLDWEQAKLALEKTRITAPISGTITERLVTLGTLVRENDVVFRIVDFDSLVAPAFVPEKYLPQLRVGQPATVRAAGAGESWRPARILRISPVIDAESGTVEVLLAIDRREGLRPGMFANVQIVLDEHADVPVVPKKALVHEDERPHLFVVDGEGRARRRPVELGYEDAERVEIAQGVEPGELVVVVGQSALKDGALVAAEDEEGRPVRFGEGAESGADAPAAGAS